MSLAHKKSFKIRQAIKLPALSDYTKAHWAGTRVILCVLLVFFTGCTKNKNNSKLTSEEIQERTRLRNIEMFGVVMENQNIGTYLPEIFINSLAQTGSYTKSMESIPSECMTLLSINKDIVHSNDHFTDQYAMLKEDVEEFIFAGNSETKKIEYKNFTYVRIDESPDYYDAIKNYIYHIFFDMIENVSLYEGLLKIDEAEFGISLNVSFFEYQTPPELFLYDKTTNYSARFEKDGKYLVLRKMEENSLMTEIETDEVSYKFELKYKY